MHITNKIARGRRKFSLISVNDSLALHPLRLNINTARYATSTTFHLKTKTAYRTLAMNNRVIRKTNKNSFLPSKIQHHSTHTQIPNSQIHTSLQYTWPGRKCHMGRVRMRRRTAGGAQPSSARCWPDFAVRGKSRPAPGPRRELCCSSVQAARDRTHTHSYARHTRKSSRVTEARARAS